MRQSWTGPPVLLVLVTLVGFAVAPLLERAPVRSTATLVATSPPPAGPPAATGRAPRAGEERAARPERVGVASLHLSSEAAVAAADARRLVGRADVDVIGWQGLTARTAVLDGLPGWRSVVVGSGLAVSWRTAAYRLRTSRLEGAVAQVVLEQRSSGRRLAVVDTRLPAGVEDAEHLGRWADTPRAAAGRARLRAVAAAWRTVSTRPGTRWAVGTGDLRFGVRADELAARPDGPRRTLGPVAVSTYEVLGSRTPATFVPEDRRFDYVWVDRAAWRRGTLTVVRHRVLGGYRGEHRPLLATLRLT